MTWVDELEGTWVEERCGMAVFDNICSNAAVFWKDGTKEVLERPYGRIDGVHLKAKLTALCGTEVLRNGMVTQVDHYKEHSTVGYLSNGGSTSVNARLVMDATGHYTQFLEYEEGPQRKCGDERT